MLEMSRINYYNRLMSFTQVELITYSNSIWCVMYALIVTYSNKSIIIIDNCRNAKPLKGRIITHAHAYCKLSLSTTIMVLMQMIIKNCRHTNIWTSIVNSLF